MQSPLGRHHRGPLPIVRPPLAGVDPICNERVALALIRLVTSPFPVYETIAVLLDHERRGISILSVANTECPDSILTVTDRVVETASRCDEVDGVLIASIRPGAGDELDDLERWFTIDDELERVGVELVEWFVLGTGVSLPRTLVGARSRWPS